MFMPMQFKEILEENYRKFTENYIEHIQKIYKILKKMYRKIYGKFIEKLQKIYRNLCYEDILFQKNLMK